MPNEGVAVIETVLHIYKPFSIWLRSVSLSSLC